MKRLKRMHPQKYPEALIEIRPSKMLKNQIGVFAIRNLKRGTVVGKVKYLQESLFFTWDDYRKIDKATRKIIDAYCIGTPEGFFAPLDINHMSIPWHFNHSCSGNLGFDKQGNFITIKAVKKNEELLFDYGLAEHNPSFRMNCKCKSKNCRKIITGNDWNNSIFRKINFKFMLPELKLFIWGSLKINSRTEGIHDTEECCTIVLLPHHRK